MRRDIQGKPFEVYIDKREIEKTILALSERINKDYEGLDLVIIGVLDGVVLFLGDLIKKLDIDLTLELIKLKSYSGSQSTGEVKEVIGISQSLKGKHILIVEDIIDTGLTLEFLLNMLKKEDFESLEIVSLLLKEDVFKEKFPIKYVGKKIANKFVVGYGMDFDGRGRHFPDIYACNE